MNAKRLPVTREALLFVDAGGEAGGSENGRKFRPNFPYATDSVRQKADFALWGKALHEEKIARQIVRQILTDFSRRDREGKTRAFASAAHRLRHMGNLRCAVRR